MSQYDSEYPLVGYRKFRIMGPQWGIPEYSLVGCHRSSPWIAGEPMVAKCLPYNKLQDCTEGPLAQSKQCKCGLHIWYTLHEAADYKFCGGPRGYVVAMAAGGGRVLFDSKFARCEIAEVIAIIDPKEYEHKGYINNPTPKLEQRREWAKGAAERYGVPVLSNVEAIKYVYREEIGVFVSGVRGDSDDPEAIVEGLD